ncbi:alcohol dehydrogenase catalytic domain-containing protein [Streptomyces sp. NBC_00490]
MDGCRTGDTGLSASPEHPRWPVVRGTLPASSGGGRAFHRAAVPRGAVPCVCGKRSTAPGAGEVLVSVGASSVNGHDVLVRAGELKIVSGRWFPIGVGLYFAGVVAATGADVEDYQVGERVGARGIPGSGTAPVRRPSTWCSLRTASRPPRRASRRLTRPPWSSRARRH